MPVDPGTAILVAKGAEALGGLLGGGGNKGMSDKDRAEMQRQFDEQQRLAQELGRTGQTMDQVGQIGGINRQMESLPVRDKVLYMLSQRMGQVPQRFQGNDMFNPGGPAPQQGGIDTGALTSAAASYQPGQGGTDRRVYDAMMAKLGVSQGENGPSIGNVDILDPHVQWGRAPNTRMNAEYEASEAARRRGLPYTPPAPPQAPQAPQGPSAPPGYPGGGGGITEAPGGGGGMSPWPGMNQGMRRPTFDPGRRY